MDVNANKDATEGKGKQNGLLVLLLILVAGFGYVYFFTDLIKPSQEQKTAEAPPAPQVVKKPLPSPDGKPAKVAAADEDGDVKKTAAQPAKPEPAKVAAAPAQTPAPVAAPKPAAKPVEKEAAKPKEPAKKDETPQPSVKKPLPGAAAKPADAKAVPADKKQPAADKKAAPAKEGEKKTADAKKGTEKTAPATAKQDSPKPAKKEPAVAGEGLATNRWTVVVGNYVLEEALATDLARVRKAGFEAYVVPAGPKKTHMIRLLLAEFTDRASAQAELDKLKRHTSDAFIIDSAGMHMVYAGSYMLDSRANFEKDRLTAAGFGLTLKKADVSIPSKNLTAGSYAEKSAAEDVLKKLRAAGVKAALTR